MNQGFASTSGVVVSSARPLSACPQMLCSLRLCHSSKARAARQAAATAEGARNSLLNCARLWSWQVSSELSSLVQRRQGVVGCELKRKAAVGECTVRRFGSGASTGRVCLASEMQEYAALRRMEYKAGQHTQSWRHTPNKFHKCFCCVCGRAARSWQIQSLSCTLVQDQPTHGNRPISEAVAAVKREQPA
jgi:hypothetical protein